MPPPPKVTPTKEVAEEQIFDFFGGEFLPAPSPLQVCVCVCAIYWQSEDITDGPHTYEDMFGFRPGLRIEVRGQESVWMVRVRSSEMNYIC